MDSDISAKRYAPTQRDGDAADDAYGGAGRRDESAYADAARNGYEVCALPANGSTGRHTAEAITVPEQSSVVRADDGKDSAATVVMPYAGSAFARRTRLARAWMI